MEPEHLYKNSRETYHWKAPDNLPPFRYVYNDQKVKKYKEKEIKALKAKMKKIEGAFNKKLRISKRTNKKRI